ncbi:protein LTV1 homolog [Drosophila guanche]|uniref:Protein LTV1 homolog n=1 Tax=Drosophila guanche TaxID=7266 RepID=A0A3B0J0G9_DROGU|nr:protein LTV1 homolog [Drosophila guanche]XP_034652458.1 protein LTV1 homolog [Drosophila subobscura]SPP74165.1 blast:Protein LTV1 homolog [Drosophila guanche]
MVKGKKPYIDRKKAVTFHLVHRSQHDPLVTDENAPQRVLLEAAARQRESQAKKKEEAPADPAKRQEEQKKFGIHFDDDYDYLQHMKKRENDVVWEYMENPNHAKKRQEDEKPSTAPKLVLPSSVFASEFEEKEGMLNKAAPQSLRLDWDPDVVAALDSDCENEELEDDFVMQAMGGEGDEDDDDEEQDWTDEEDGGDEDMDFDSDNMNEDEDEDELMDRLAPLMRERRFDDEEVKSRFTEYSMSSSVIRRNEQLSLLDDRFEKFYASYDDPELGDLALEDIEGNWHQKHPVVMQCFQEFKKKNKTIDYNKEWDRERIAKYRNVVEGEEDPNEELVEYEVDDPKQKKWDCESILSTYSNIYNHPKLIDEPRRSRRSSASSAPEPIQIDPKTGLPVNVLRGGVDGQLTAKALANLADDSNAATGPKSLCAKSVLSTLSVLSIRPKDESAEEKKERKRLLKDYRNERRIEKKANTEAFKDEKKRQTHVKINQRTNQQGATIV